MGPLESIRLSLPDGGWLQGDVAPGPGPCAVLFIHGFGSVRQGEKAQALQEASARRGWTFAAFDFRGHGESSGAMLDLRASGLLDDLDAIHAFLARRGIHRLFPVGSSMGGWAAAWFTLLHPETVPACVLLAPALFFLTSRWSKLSDAERQAWRQTGRLRVRNDWVDTEIPYALVEERGRYPFDRLTSEWRKPLLIFHGLRDDMVPYTQSLQFMQQAECPKIELSLLKDGDHRLTAYKEEIAEAACAFFGRWQ